MSSALELEAIKGRKKMPFKSRAQRRWGNSPSGHAALGDAGVKEWDQASKGLSLPRKLGSRLKNKPAPTGATMKWGMK
jgi:hypothetical protein